MNKNLFKFTDLPTGDAWGTNADNFYYYLFGHLNKYLYNIYLNGDTKKSLEYFSDYSLEYSFTVVSKNKSNKNLNFPSEGYEEGGLLCYILHKQNSLNNERRLIKIAKYNNEGEYVLQILSNKEVSNKEIDSIHKSLNCNKISKPRVNIIEFRHKDFRLLGFDLKFKDFDLNDNYNEDLLDFDKYINNQIENKNGLILLHGEPGTGKTYYIRHLIKNLSKDKKCIIIPQHLIQSISDPSFVGFILDNKNSVFILEDAEDVLRTREGGFNAGISNILNMSDGLIGDALSPILICTFNTGKENIDQALLRKGRLLGMHEFKKLNKKKSQKLVDKLGISYNVKEEMSLAEIYNLSDKNFSRQKERIGF